MEGQPGFVLEEHVSLPQSMLWTLQRDFYQQRALEGWNQGIVPQYITTNPFIAGAYARVVFAFLRDCRAAGEEPGSGGFAPLDLSQPLYLVELGSGPGRFAYLFLKKLLGFYRRSVLRAVPFTYVMTDFAQRNIDFWRGHPAAWVLSDERRAPRRIARASPAGSSDRCALARRREGCSAPIPAAPESPCCRCCAL